MGTNCSFPNTLRPLMQKAVKQTGARWRVRRVERMAALCAVQASDQWDAYWAGAF